TANAGYYYVVGYGGKIEIPTMEMVATEKTIVGNLVGTYPDLVELMALAERGKVNLATREYRLSEGKTALHDLAAGKVKGRGGLIPGRSRNPFQELRSTWNLPSSMSP